MILCRSTRSKPQLEETGKQRTLAFSVGLSVVASTGARMVKKKERKRLERIIDAERKVFKSCNAPAFEKRLVSLPSSGELINTLSLGNRSTARHIVFLPGGCVAGAPFSSSICSSCFSIWFLVGSRWPDPRIARLGVWGCAFRKKCSPTLKNLSSPPCGLARLRWF